MSGVFGKRHAFLRLAGFAGVVVLAAGTTAAQDVPLRGAVDEAEVNAALIEHEQADALDTTTTGSTGAFADRYDSADPGTLYGEPAESMLSDRALEPNSVRLPELPSIEESTEPEADTAGQNDSDVAAGSLDRDRNGEMRSQRMNTRVTAIEGAGRTLDEEDPYAPLGLRFSTFLLMPTIEQGLTWTSNANDSPDAQGALLSETTLQLNAVSDWSRHRASLEAFGTFQKSISGEEISDFDGAVETALELDLAGGYSGRAGLGYSVGRESASSPIALVGVEKQPLRHTLDGALGLEKAVGPIRFGITGEVSRDQYGDARLDDGTALPQDDRDSTLALVRLRGGYELSPALIPFVEIEAGRRFYDEKRDSAGYERSATQLGARAGLALDLSEKLSGEVSAGWVSEDFDDSRLETVSGPALAANLAWSPMRGTIVILDASTVVEGSTDAGESGSLLHSAILRLERQMRANLTGDLAFGVDYRDYSGGGHDLILSGEAALTWWLNRYAALTARARHERQTSSLSGRDYETTSIFMGMKFQR